MDFDFSRALSVGANVDFVEAFWSLADFVLEVRFVSVD